jgi:DNA polymerase sigma
MNRYPQLNLCTLAFKYILAQRGFNSNFKGGIGSYCLFVMIAAYIKEYPELESLSEAEFFISTLKFYG